MLASLPDCGSIFNSTGVMSAELPLEDDENARIDLDVGAGWTRAAKFDNPGDR